VKNSAAISQFKFLLMRDYTTTITITAPQHDEVH